MRREISPHGSNPNRLFSSPTRQRRPIPDGAAVAWVLSFSAYSQKLSAALPIARFHPIWDRCAAATGRLSTASRFRTSTVAFILPAASTFQEVIRRLHGSFQFPTVSALHLYVLWHASDPTKCLFWAQTGPCDTLWTALARNSLRLCRNRSPIFGSLGKVWERAWPCLAFSGAMLCPAWKEFSPLCENSMPQCGFTVKLQLAEAC